MNESLANAVPWIVILIVAVVVVLLMSREKRRMRNRSDADFERDAAESKGSMLAAGARGIEMVLGSEEKRAAIEYKKDMEEGVTKTGSKGDDADRTAGGAHGQDQKS
jgi:hypothetical protein